MIEIYFKNESIATFKSVERSQFDEFISKMKNDTRIFTLCGTLFNLDNINSITYKNETEG